MQWIVYAGLFGTACAGDLFVLSEALILCILCLYAV